MGRDWRREADGRLVLWLGGATWVVRLLTAPFLLLGLAIVLGWTASMGRAVLAGDWGQALELLPGLIGVVIVGLPLGIIGWIVVLGRRRVVLDGPRDAITAELDLLLYRRHERHRVAEFAAVHFEPTTAGRSSTVVWHVWLEPADGERARRLLLAVEPDADAARALATAAAAALGLPGRETTGQLDPPDDA